MKITKGQKESVSLFESFAEKLVSRVPKRTQPFFLALILGALLAIAKRRTVTQWLKAAQISDDFRQAFYHMSNIGRKGEKHFPAFTVSSVGFCQDWQFGLFWGCKIVVALRRKVYGLKSAA